MSDSHPESVNASLQRRLDEAEQTVRALVSGEIDALVAEAGATPVLLHVAQARLRANVQLLRAVFDGAMDAMLIVDDDGRTVDANAAACVLFGRARARLLGSKLADFRDPGFTDSEPESAPGPGERKERYFALRRLDGERRETEYRVTPSILPGMSLAVLRDITDRRRTESRFRTMIEKSHDGIALLNAAGQSIYVSKAVERILDRPASDLEGARSTDFVHPEDRQHVAAALQRLLATPRSPAHYEFRALHRDDSIRWVEVTARNFLHDPAVAAIVGNFRDITEQKAAQAALEASQRNLEDAQAMAHLGSWTSGCAPDALVSWSAECARIFGYAPGSAPQLGQLLEVVHIEDRQRVQVAWERGLSERAAFESEHRLLLANGETRWVIATMRTEAVPQGSPDSVRLARAGLESYRVVGVVQDITERKRVVDELRASELRYRRIVDNTSEGVWMYDAANITTFMNPRMTEMLGCSLNDALGQSIFSFMDEAAMDQARAWGERRKRGIADRREFRLKRRDGADVWVSLLANPLFDQAGNFESALALVTDITERRRADEARNRLASIVESSADAIISRGIDGIIRTWNGGAEKLTLYTAEEAIGKPIAMLYLPDQAAPLEHQHEGVDQGRKPEHFEMVALRKDGSHVDVSVTSSVLQDDGGARIGVSIIARDITERKRSEAALRQSEEQLRQAQKLEAIGSLAGGIAHDFNNVLSVILGYTTLIVNDLQTSDPLRADLLEVQTAGMRASRLVRQLLAFSRQQMLQPVVLDINQVVSGIKVMLLRLLREDIPLSLLTSPLAGKVHADPGQIEQVIINLVVNARDAMPNGGALSIETTNIVLDAGYVAKHPGVTAGAHVLLAVTDTGIGMEAATKARMFEPFFTTKEKDQGTGLGLSTVYGIVQQSGGHLSVDSEPGKGTTVNVYLPRTDRALETAVAASAAVDAGGTETILLVEDEEQVRSIIRQILRRQGYNVLEAQNAGEAFLICEQFSDPIHLLLTDVVMPRMSGRRLAERLVQSRPEMRVLYVSGYTDDMMVHHGVAGAGIQFLQKPILPASLSRKVRHVLDTPAHPN